MYLWCVEDCTPSMITNPDISVVISGVMTQTQERSSHSVSVISQSIMIEKGQVLDTNCFLPPVVIQFNS